MMAVTRIIIDFDINRPDANPLRLRITLAPGWVTITYQPYGSFDHRKLGGVSRRKFRQWTANPNGVLKVGEKLSIQINDAGKTVYHIQGTTPWVFPRRELLRLREIL